MVSILILIVVFLIAIYFVGVIISTFTQIFSTSFQIATQPEFSFSKNERLVILLFTILTVVGFWWLFNYIL
jgi:uncharacterized BrkB/YihY/UPF0761 family membrane protein